MWKLELLTAIVLFLGYRLSGWLVLSLPHIIEGITLYWPPIGLATACLYRGRWWFVVPYFLADISLSLFILPVSTSLFIAIGNIGMAVCAVVLLRALRFDAKMLRIRDTVILVFAALISGGCSAVVGPYSLYKAGIIPNYTALQEGIFYWWLSDSAGILIFGAFGLTVQWYDWNRVRERLITHLSILMGFVLLTSVLFSFDYNHRNDLEMMSLASLAIGLAVIALNFSYGFTLFLAMIVSVVSLIQTTEYKGPLLGMSPREVLTTAWSWMLVNSLIVFVLGGIRNKLQIALSALEQEKQQYAVLVNGNPALIVRFLTDGTILFANDTAEKLFRGIKPTIVGSRITDYLRSEDLPRVYELLLSPGEPQAIDLMMTTSHRDEHCIRWKASNIRDLDNRIVEFIAVGFDVTDARRAENQRRVVLERLYHAKKLESLGAMAGGIAHEFNNLLTGIIGHTELAKEQTKEFPSIENHLKIIEESSQRAAELVRQMMAYAGQSRVMIEPVQLGEEIQTVIDLLRLNLSPQIEIRHKSSEELPTLDADAIQMRQVVMNLLLNAIEAIGSNPGIIEIQTAAVQVREDTTQDLPITESQPLLGSGTYVRLSVRDNGPGMSGSIQRKVFEPFFTTKFPGRGLGLAAVLGIVQNHSGRITVNSAPGKGSLFTVLLPVQFKSTKKLGSDELLPEMTSSTSLPLVKPGRAYLLIQQSQELALVEEWLQKLGWMTFVSKSSMILKLDNTMTGPPQLAVLDCSSQNATLSDRLRVLRGLPPNLKAIIITDFSILQLPPETNLTNITFLIRPLREADLEQAICRLYPERSS